MEVLYLLVPLSLALIALVVWAVLWAVRSGQFEDLEGPAHRILMDDDTPRAGAQNHPPRAGARDQPARGGAQNQPPRAGAQNQPARAGAQNQPARGDDPPTRTEQVSSSTGAANGACGPRPGR
jgi:cbb3-type cytochrome oxidase maturation protein